MSPVLVTGGSGYVGTQLIAALLRGRSSGARDGALPGAASTMLRAAVRRGDADDSGLEVVTADLTADEGWAAAAAGCEEVHHVASPIPAAQPDDPDELIVPAREGTLRVLRAARDAGARRVVLTSSFAAIGYSPKPGAEYTEADWTDPDTPGLAPYPRSKAIAERAAWDFIEHEGGEHRAGRGQPDVHPRPDADDAGALVVAADQGDARRDDARRATPALRRRRRARRGRSAHPCDGRARGRRQAVPGPGRRPDDQLPARWPRSCASGSARWPSECRPKKRPGPELPRLIIHNDRASRSSAGAHARPRPRSSRPPRACATSACWRNDDDEQSPSAFRLSRGHRL